MKKIIYIGLSIIASFAIANVSVADELEEVIISSALIDSQNEISKPVHVISAKAVSSEATQSVGTLIDGLMGVSSSDFGAAVGQPVIRGLSGSRVKILNNGKVVRDISSLGPDHANEIDLGLLEQIEIVRGPSSLLYANGAVGGIVNIVDSTIAKQDIAATRFNLGGGYEDGNGGNTGHASVVGNIGGLNLSSSFQYSNLGNYNIPEHALHEDGEHGGHDEHDAKTLENSDFEKTGLKIGVSKVEDWGYAGFSYADSSSTYGIPYHGDGHDEGHDGDDHDGDDHDGDDHAGDEHESHEGERIFADTNSETLNFEGSYNFTGGLVNTADFYIRRTSYDHTEQHAEEHGAHDGDDHDGDDHDGDDHDGDDHDGDDHDGDDHDDHGEGTLFTNESTEFGLTLDIGSNETIEKLSLNIAQEEFTITGHEAFLEPTQSDEITLGYFSSKDIDSAHIDFGVRYDRIERESENSSYDANLGSISATASREIAKDLGVSIGFSSVLKAPSAMELFVNGPHLVTQRFEKGDATLEPEKANNFDLALNAAVSGFDANLNLYRNNISNYIYLQDTETKQEDLVVSEYRQQDAVFKGYELEISRSVALENGSLKVSLGRDYVDAQFDQGGYIPRSVPTRNILNFNYKGNNGLDWALSVKDVQKQSNVASEEEEEGHHNEGEDEHEHEEHGESATDGYVWVNFSLSQEIKTSESEAITVSFFAKNLLNEIARNHSSFVKDEVPLPGRNMGFKVNYNF
ncbi:TonB-dependent receptor [Porticoccaceae bacterium]|nr:TonB-dependent receptor [Porticoccaceae bacterium]